MIEDTKQISDDEKEEEDGYIEEEKRPKQPKCAIN